MFMTLCCHSYLCWQESVYKITFKNNEAKFQDFCYVNLVAVGSVLNCAS
jgi:hypothetical protein